MRKRLFLITFITFLPFYLFTLALPARAARLYFEPGERSVAKGSVFNADLWLDTEGVKTSGADVVLEYDTENLLVDGVSFSDIYSSGTIRKKDNINGRLELSVYFTDLFSSYEGRGRLATIRLGAGNSDTELNFVCQAGATAETNVLQFNGGDIVNCGSLGELKIKATGSDVEDIGTIDEPEATGGDDDGQGVQPPGDTTSVDSPDRPTGLTAASGPGRGQVSLRWNRVSGATHYAIAYGERWLDFDYGAANVGDTDQFLVNGLATGAPYYFVVAAVRDGASSGWSDGASAYAGWGAVSTSRQTVYTPTTEKGTSVWEPPEPVEEFKEDEDEATEGAEFEPSPSPKESLKPYYEPPEPKKPWQQTSFWKKLGWILLGLFLLWLLLGFLRRRKKSKKDLRPEIEKERSSPEPPWKEKTEIPQGPPPTSSPPPPF